MSVACKWYSRKIAWCPNCSGQLISDVCLHISLQKNDLINPQAWNGIPFFSSCKGTLPSQKFITLPEHFLSSSVKGNIMKRFKYPSMLTGNLWQPLHSCIPLYPNASLLVKKSCEIQRKWQKSLQNFKDFQNAVLF